MSTSNEKLQKGDHCYFAPEHGTVIDNADPEGLHRIRAEVHGVCEKTQWAWPVGTQGGGSAGRGASVVPDIGATVVILFLGGDVERPVYMSGWWGTPQAGSEMPTEAAAVPVGDAYQVQVLFETKRIKAWIDERPGKEQFVIQDKENDETYIQMDLTTGALRLGALAAILLDTPGLAKVMGSEVQLLDRRVMPDSKAI